MKFTNIILVSLITFLSSLSLAHDLYVEISAMRSSKGNVLVSVYNSEEGFPKEPEKAYRKIKMTSIQAAKFVIKDLPSGTYALAVAHDENSNDKIDTGFLGIPKEGVGFSRNPSITFGPPSFSKAAYTINADGQIEIKMHYY